MNHQQAMIRLRKRAEEYKKKSEVILPTDIDFDGIGDVRLKSMAKSIAKEYPEFLKLVPPTERATGLYRRIRSIQIKGKCCGYDMSKEQLKEILALAGRDSVRDKLAYMCRIIDKLHTKRTLEIVDRRLTDNPSVANAVRRLKVSSEYTIKLWRDMLIGKYSLDDIMIACEIAEKKDNPPAYFTAIFRNGKPKWLVENETH